MNSSRCSDSIPRHAAVQEKQHPASSFASYSQWVRVSVSPSIVTSSHRPESAGLSIFPNYSQRHFFFHGGSPSCYGGPRDVNWCCDWMDWKVEVCWVFSISFITSPNLPIKTKHRGYLQTAFATLCREQTSLAWKATQRLCESDRVSSRAVVLVDLVRGWWWCCCCQFSASDSARAACSAASSSML